MRPTSELDDVREEIQVLRRLIDVALDSRVGPDDPLLHACAATLRERRHLLEVLETEREVA